MFAIFATLGSLSVAFCNWKHQDNLYVKGEYQITLQKKTKTKNIGPLVSMCLSEKAYFNYLECIYNT